MSARLLAILVAVALVVAAAGVARAEGPLTQKERAAMRREVKLVAKPYLVDAAARFVRPTLKVPSHTIIRLPNGDLRAEAHLTSIGRTWSPIPERVVKEKAIFTKPAGQPAVVTEDWHEVPPQLPQPTR